MDEKIKEEEEDVLAEIKEPVTDSLQDEATNKIEKIEKVEKVVVEDKSLNENTTDENNCDTSPTLDNKDDFAVAEVVEQDDKTQDSQYEFKSSDEGKNKMKDNPNAQPYNQNNEVKRTTSDDAGTIAMVLGIIAMVCSVLGPLALVGLVLGILALVKGSKVRKFSSSGMAGWVLGIIAIVFSGVKVFVILAFITPFIWFSPFFM